MTLSDAFTRYTEQVHRRATRPHMRFVLRTPANDARHGSLCGCPHCEHGSGPSAA